MMLSSVVLAGLIKLNVTLVVVLPPNPQPGAMTSMSLQTYIEEFKETFREAGVNPKVTLAYMDDIWPYLDTVGWSPWRFIHYRQWAWKTGLKKPRMIVHFLFPPMWDAERHVFGYIGGLANICTIRRRIGISISNGADFTPYGDRSGWVSRTISHEAGHQCGATHVQTQTIMNTLLLYIIQNLGPSTHIPWDSFSVQQIHNCLRKPPRKRLKLIKEPIRFIG